MVDAVNKHPMMAALAMSIAANLKIFRLLRLPVPKKIKPFNIVYVNFHCGRGDRLLESLKVEGVVPLFGQ